MSRQRQKLFILLVFTISVPVLASAASVYETQEEFLTRSFGDSTPDPGIVWLSGERKTRVQQILGHDYIALRLRYWCQDGRSAWVLNDIGKELPITVGVIIDSNYIENLRVLTYRENRGGEVATPAFTDQFSNASLQSNGTLDTGVDGITGATLSVRALTRLANLALFLHGDAGCSNGT